MKNLYFPEIGGGAYPCATPKFAIGRLKEIEVGQLKRATPIISNGHICIYCYFCVENIITLTFYGVCQSKLSHWAQEKGSQLTLFVPGKPTGNQIYLVCSRYLVSGTAKRM